MTSVTAHRDKAAIQRNLAELQRAILESDHAGRVQTPGVSHLFLKLTYFAFFNDYVAHCVEVFEIGRRPILLGDSSSS